MNETRKNILWIQTDEQRTDSMGCYGGTLASTPVLDGLAASGTMFANHHVQSPVCVPSRVCELTGLLPHRTGIFNNDCHYNWGTWPAGIRTFPEVFAQHGYVTANFGKYHTPHHSTWLENYHFELFPDEADQFSLGTSFKDEVQEVIHLGHEPNGVILSGRYPSVHGGRTPQTHVTDVAVNWLKEYRHVRRPFLARVSYLAPHTPVLAPEHLYHRFDEAPDDWEEPDGSILASRPAYELDDAALARFRAHSRNEIMRMRKTYGALVSHVDEQVGRLLAALKETGDLDSTIIVYTSDHGNLIGEYGQFQKGVFYDLTTRVPCMICGPGIPQGRRVDDLSASIDLGRTLMQIAGINPPEDFRGPGMFDAGGLSEVTGEIALPRNGHLARRSWIRTGEWSLDVTTSIDGHPVRDLKDMDGKLSRVTVDSFSPENLFNEPEHAPVIRNLLDRLYLHIRDTIEE